MKIAALTFTLISIASVAQGQQSLVNEGVVEAPVDSVWIAFTTAEGLQSWMAPHASFDLRIGGSMQSAYAQDATLGDASTIVNTVLAYEPQRMLALKVAKAPAGFPFPNAIGNMWSVIYFDALESRRTRVRVVSMGFGTDDESQRMRQFFSQGNAYTVLALQKRFGAATK